MFAGCWMPCLGYGLRLVTVFCTLDVTTGRKRFIFSGQSWITGFRLKRQFLVALIPDYISGKAYPLSLMWTKKLWTTSRRRHLYPCALLTHFSFREECLINSRQLI